MTRPTPTPDAMKSTAPVRVRRTYTQHLEAPPEEVFPLLCPVREADWVPGWAPRAVYSESGVAEPSGVFTTPVEGAEDDPHRDAVWVITHHDPQAGWVDFVKVTPGVTAAQITIRLAASGDGGTQAQVTYQHTALSPEGEDFVAGFTDEHYEEFMQGWEGALNHYLATGEMVAEPGGG